MRKPFFLLFLISFLASFFSISIKAHSTYYVLSNLELNYSKEGSSLKYKLNVDPYVLPEIYNQIDQNRDNKFEESEVKSFTEQIFLPNFSLKLNDQAIIPIYNFYVGKTFEEAGSITSPLLEIYFKLDLKFTDTNKIEAKFSKKFLPEDPYGDLISFTDNAVDNPLIVKHPTKLILMGQEFLSVFSFVQTAPANKSFWEKIKSSPERTWNQLNEVYKNGVINDSKISLITFTGLFFAVILGGMHALTPGHGKSMMAAFLVSKKKSSFSDLIVLGSSILISHTAVIFILGFIFLVLEKNINLNAITGSLEKISAVMLLLLGISILRTAYKNKKHLQNPHTHHNPSLKVQSKKDLFWAGLSGGVIPCPEAFSFLVYFVGAGKTIFGLIWVLCFSVGLAIVVLVLGSVLLYGKSKFKSKENATLARAGEIYLPIFSGVIIILLALRLFL